MVPIHAAAGVTRLIEAREDHHALHRARIRPVDVPLVGALELGRPARHARMVLRLVAHDRFLDRRMGLEVRTDEPAVPRPVVLGVAGRMHADIAAAILDEALEGLLLCIVQDIACRVQEDDHAESLEVRRRERSGILGGLDDAGGREQILHGGDAGLDAVVPEARGLREDEHTGLGRHDGNLRQGGYALHAERGGVSRPCSPCRVRCVQHRCATWRADDRHDEAHCTDGQGRRKRDHQGLAHRSPGPLCSAPRDP